MINTNIKLFFGLAMGGPFGPFISLSISRWAWEEINLHEVCSISFWVFCLRKKFVRIECLILKCGHGHVMLSITTANLSSFRSWTNVVRRFQVVIFRLRPRNTLNNLLGHPPYSSDYAPCDFFVFLNVKPWRAGSGRTLLKQPWQRFLTWWWENSPFWRGPLL